MTVDSHRKHKGDSNLFFDSSLSLSVCLFFFVFLILSSEFLKYLRRHLLFFLFFLSIWPSLSYRNLREKKKKTDQRLSLLLLLRSNLTIHHRSQLARFCPRLVLLLLVPQQTRRGKEEKEKGEKKREEREEIGVSTIESNQVESLLLLHRRWLRCLYRL